MKKETMNGTGDKKAPRLFSELSPEELKTERGMLIRDLCKTFHKIMILDGSSHYRWRGTLIDLMELTHSVWLTGEFSGKDGRPLSFITMAKHVCQVMHRREVANPFVLVNHATKRKGVRGMSVIDRYTKLRVQYLTEFPMDLDIKCI